MRIQLMLVALCVALQLMAQQWHSLGPGLNQTVYSIVIDGSDVYAGGNFTDAGGQSDADYLARWDGYEWHAVAPGLNGIVRAIAIKDSLLYVGGDFTDLEFTAHIACWDGKQWTALGDGLNGTVYTLAVVENDVYAGGAFSNKISRWDGSKWNALGSALNGTVFTIKAHGGEIYAGGSFVNAGGDAYADKVARWDGQTWHHLTTAPLPNVGIWPTGVREIVFYGQDAYLIGDYIQCTGLGTTPYLFRWDGSEFHEVYPNDECRFGSSICVAGNYLYIGVIDYFSTDAGIHRWDLVNHEWEYFVGGWIISNVYDYGDIVLASDGTNVYVGHSFTEMGGYPDGIILANNIARLGGDLTSTAQLTDDTRVPSHVYPNPSEDEFTLSLSGNADLPVILHIYDSVGRDVEHINSAGESKIHFGSHLQPGLYYAMVVQGNERQLLKLAKM